MHLFVKVIYFYRKSSPIFSFSFLRMQHPNLNGLLTVGAADKIRTPPVPLKDIYYALLIDLGWRIRAYCRRAASCKCRIYMRHAMSETISEAVVNCLMVTDSSEANHPTHANSRTNICSYALSLSFNFKFLIMHG